MTAQPDNAMQWFRWYQGTTEDTKLRMVARKAGVTLRDVIAVWAMIMESASYNSNEGHLKFQSDYIAVNLDFTESEIDKIWSAMEEIGIIKNDDAGTVVTNWGKRQYLSDRSDSTNAVRQRRWREKQGNEQFSLLPNGDVTEKKRPDSDTERSPPKVPPGTWERFWEAYPEKVGKGAARRAFEKAIQKATIKILLEAICYYRETKPPDRSWCHPATWLNQERWLDQPDISQANGKATNGHALADPILQLERASLIQFKKHGTWYAEDGPKPSEPGCKLSAALLKEFGYLSADAVRDFFQ